jgi:maltose-binding protein MalE
MCWIVTRRRGASVRGRSASTAWPSACSRHRYDSAAMLGAVRFVEDLVHRHKVKEFIGRNPDAKVALDQLAYAKPWFATYPTVAVRKALEDEVQAVLNGKKKPDQAVKDAQRRADELLRPYIDPH